MELTHYILMGAMFAGSIVYAIYASKKTIRASAAQEASVGPGIERLHTHVEWNRAEGESDPVCVVAYHYPPHKFEMVFVGVTNERILVVKDEGPIHEFPYDYEGEHLPNEQKTEQERGFFFWMHKKKLPGGGSAYTPEVKNHPPFAEEQWHMHPEVPGHPQQLENLRKFSSIFYFQWFY